MIKFKKDMVQKKVLGFALVGNQDLWTNFGKQMISRSTDALKMEE